MARRPRHSRGAEPQAGQALDIFEELVYFTRVFPHPRLTIEVVLVEVEEWRYPGHGRRAAGGETTRSSPIRNWSRSARSSARTGGRSDRTDSRQTAGQFHTGHLAELAGIPHVAQRIAYCLRKMKAVEQIGKQGNALFYRLPTRRRRSPARRRRPKALMREVTSSVTQPSERFSRS